MTIITHETYVSLADHELLNFLKKFLMFLKTIK